MDITQHKYCGRIPIEADFIRGITGLYILVCLCWKCRGIGHLLLILTIAIRAANNKTRNGLQYLISATRPVMEKPHSF